VSGQWWPLRLAGAVPLRVTRADLPCPLPPARLLAMVVVAMPGPYEADAIAAWFGRRYGKWTPWLSAAELRVRRARLEAEDPLPLP
jgi:hypothetical protein